VLVLTPPLNLGESLIAGFIDALESSVGALGS